MPPMAAYGTRAVLEGRMGCRVAAAQIGDSFLMGIVTGASCQGVRMSLRMSVSRQGWVLHTSFAHSSEEVTYLEYCSESQQQQQIKVKGE
jgi:hypothetical protein